MRPDDQQMTISNFNANNHVNLVKVKKIDTDNMISLDIISANCYNGMLMKWDETRLWHGQTSLTYSSNIYFQTFQLNYTIVFLLIYLCPTLDLTIL